jgi:peptide/nickel transport system ATP-binding protein
MLARGGAGLAPTHGDEAGRPLIDVEDLRVHFDTPRGTVRAVDGVTFQLGWGDTLGVVGESGSGKSVMVRAIMNILPENAERPDGQRIVFAGVPVDLMPRQRRRHFWGLEVAMVFQDPMRSLNPVRRIGVQLTESMRHHLGISAKEAKARSIELLGLVGLSDPARRMRQFPHQLSGGMRQRVTIAIALACRPKLLIADEPTTALDVTVQKQILDLLARLQRELGMSMILITHDLGVVRGRTSTTAVMYAGRFVEVGPTATLFSETRHPYSRALIDSIPTLAQSSHRRLEAIAGRPPDLVRPRVGCAFAPRCTSAQPRCLVDDPPLVGAAGHEYRCHYPLGTAAGDTARADNLRAGHTAAGLALASAGR